MLSAMAANGCQWGDSSIAILGGMTYSSAKCTPNVGPKERRERKEKVEPAGQRERMMSGPLVGNVVTEGEGQA